jgi:hypothetical protein
LEERIKYNLQKRKHSMVLSYLLAGLPSDYDSFVTSITTENEALSLEEVYAHLAYEACQLCHHSEMQAGHGSSVNYVGCCGGSRGCGRGDHGRGLSNLGGGGLLRVPY